MREMEGQRSDPPEHRKVEDRAVGCLVGLALGDALGAPFESMRAHAIPQPLPAFELPWTGFPPGSTTDDTAMARNLARSLAERGHFDPDGLLARHLEWFTSDPPDVGNLTRRVLRRVQQGEAAEDAARAEWEERGPEISAGNGSVMYCAPLGVAYANRPDELLEVAPRLSALTHFDPRCRTACLAVTVAVAALVRGKGPDRAVELALDAVADHEGGEELEFLVDAVGSSRLIDGPDQGFCLFAAAIGLQALARGRSFEYELRRVVSLGGDTDTNAAVAGALIGSAVGHGRLPAEWLARLIDARDIEHDAASLVGLTG
jgi:ADP-ribosyl-[dinitrogen reductase] hydrolase